MRFADLEEYLNSNWGFALTQTAAGRRRFLIIFVGASLWAWFAFLITPFPQGWDAGMSQRFLFYILDALFFSLAFPIVLLMAIFFGLVLILLPVYLPKTRPSLARFLWIAIPGLLGILWALLAYVFKKPDWDSNLSGQLLVYAFQALFAPAILRHVLVAAFVFWAAYRLAAWYLDDIFELENLSVAEGFVLQAALGSGYSMITIKEGGVAPEQRDSPLIRIGGPGWVRVNLDNAALFEKTEGESRIIGPTGERRHDAVALGAFERLRDVIDLRDQIENLAVEARTSDGILVKADDVRVAFSVYRGNRQSTLEQPYPYEEESLRQLFYNLERGAVNLAMLGLIRRELRKFISQHCLNDFLTSAGEAAEGGGQLQGNGGTPAENAPPPGFFTRPEILSDLFAAQFAGSARKNGVELRWIGVGTWVTPEVIAQRHREAWRLSQENRVRGSEPEVRRVRRESETAEFLRLVQEVPLLTFRRNAELTPMERMRRMVIAYHGLMNEVYETLLRENRDQEESNRLNRALVFLSRFTTRRPRGTTRAGAPASPAGPPHAGSPSGGEANEG